MDNQWAKYSAVVSLAVGLLTLGYLYRAGLLDTVVGTLIHGEDYALEQAQRDYEERERERLAEQQPTAVPTTPVPWEVVVQERQESRNDPNKDCIVMEFRSEEGLVVKKDSEVTTTDLYDPNLMSYAIDEHCTCIMNPLPHACYWHN